VLLLLPNHSVLETDFDLSTLSTELWSDTIPLCGDVLIPWSPGLMTTWEDARTDRAPQTLKFGGDRVRDILDLLNDDTLVGKDLFDASGDCQRDVT
jgi:hypothetical protein